MSNAESIERLRLSKGVRYRWDAIRGQHQLLYPEGLLVLNKTGAAIVKRCDGRSLEELKRELAELYSDSEIEEDIAEFINRLAQKGLISHDGNP